MDNTKANPKLEMPLNGSGHSADSKPADQQDDSLDGGLKIAPSLPGQRVSDETMQWLKQKRNTLPTSEMLTSSEQESLRQNLKDAHTYFQSVFKRPQ